MEEDSLLQGSDLSRALFQQSNVVKLVSYPDSGAIVDANMAACRFYGYTPEEFKGMTLSQLNAPVEQPLLQSSMSVEDDKGSTPLFKHRIASGEIRDVEVYSNPVQLPSLNLLYSIVHDVTSRRQAEEALRREHAKYKSILESANDPIYVINALRVVEYANPVAEQDLGLQGGRSCVNLAPNVDGPLPCCGTESGSGLEQPFRLLWTCERNNRTYDVFQTTLSNPDGTSSQLCILHNVSRPQPMEESLRLDETRFEAMLKLSQMTEASVVEIGQFALENGVKLTRSQTGFLGFLDEEETICAVHVWSKDASLQCDIDDKLLHLRIEDAGLWAESIRKREAVIFNRYSDPHPSKKGFPKGHTTLTRIMSVPVFDGERVAAIAVVGNKAEDYVASDARELALLMKGMWKTIQQKRTEEVLRESEQHLKLFSSKLLSIQEQDRFHLAQILHDSIGQSLAAIKYGVENARKVTAGGDTEMAMRSMDALIPTIQGVIEEVRRIYMDLRPTILDDLGIIAAISWFFREFSRTYKSVHLKPLIWIEEEEVPNPLKIVIFRIIQEAMSNIRKYSQATEAVFSLRKTTRNEIELTIVDDGIGFDLPSTLSSNNPMRGLGLASMRERAELSGGRFSIESTPGEGTIIRVSWPILL